jgi:hypothetical protein
MKTFTHLWLAVAFALTAPYCAQAQVSVDGSDQESLLPLNASDSRPASDLYYQGHLLLPDDAANLSRSGTHLENLNPDPTTTLWNDAYPIHLIASAKEQELAQTTTGKYLSDASAPMESYKFTIQTKDANGQPITRTVMLGRYVHNILLRKALLQKIGYVLPAIQYLPQMTVQFTDRVQRDVFISTLEEKTFSDTKRWIVSQTDSSIILQDLVITEDQDIIYNLATGFLTSEIIRGRRLLSSLIAPFSLTYIPESVNLFSWVSGTVYGNAVKVSYPNSDQFTPSSEDIIWSLKRIAHLSRADWDEIVTAGMLPSEVKAVVVEKLISRRDSFLELYQVPHDTLAFNPRISAGSVLVNGQIKQQDWPGYACRFSFGDPESPLNPGEVVAFTKSKFFSTLLANAVAKLNELPYFHTDDIAAAGKHQVAVLTKMLENYQQTGQVQKTALGLWGYPFASGNLIFGRQIVTGSYLGTNNLIQMVDQVGIRLNLGAQIGLDGLPTVMQAGFRGGVQLSRTYAHLKPIRSIRAANRYGFQNAIVPLFIGQTAHKLDALFAANFNTLTADQKDALYQSTMQAFKDQIAPGESIVITDSLVGDIRASLGATLYKIINVAVTGEDTEIVLSRLHIYRKDENTFQVYRDFGLANQPSFSFDVGLRTTITGLGTAFVNDENALPYASLPILKIKWGANNGHTKVQYYPIKFGTGSQTTEQSVENLKILQMTLLHGRTEVLTSHIKPFVLENTFRETNGQDRFLFWNYKKLQSKINLTIQNQAGAKRTFVRDFFGTTSGRDLENGGADDLSYLAQLMTHTSFDFGNDTTTNPGYTIFGRAKNQMLTYEAEINTDGTVKDPFIKLTKLSNGWSLPKAKIQKILDEYSRDYGTQLFAPTTLNDTDKMFLYNISVNIHLYDKAIANLLALTEAQIKDIFLRHGVDINDRNVADRLLDKIASFKQNRDTKALLKAIAIADRLLPADGFFELIGGKTNIFVYAKIEGFRKGDERVDDDGGSTIISNTIGIVGSPRALGPISAIESQVGMTESEFLSTWITGHLL